MKRLALAVAAIACAAGAAHAQTYPTKRITFIAPFAPGGGTDFQKPLTAAVACLRQSQYRRGDIVAVGADADIVLYGHTHRQVVFRAARNGYFFVWDRATGELLTEPWPFVYVDHITGYDMETGRALHDIDRWMFTNVEDRRRYTDRLFEDPAADNFTGTVVFEEIDLDDIAGNSTSNNQKDMGNPGNHPWNRPEVPDGQVCLP